MLSSGALTPVETPSIRRFVEAEYVELATKTNACVRTGVFSLSSWPIS